MSQQETGIKSRDHDNYLLLDEPKEKELQWTVKGHSEVSQHFPFHLLFWDSCEFWHNLTLRAGRAQAQATLWRCSSQPRVGGGVHCLSGEPTDWLALNTLMGCLLENQANYCMGPHFRMTYKTFILVLFPAFILLIIHISPKMKLLNT